MRWKRKKESREIKQQGGEGEECPIFPFLPRDCVPCHFLGSFSFISAPLPPPDAPVPDAPVLTGCFELHTHVHCFTVVWPMVVNPKEQYWKLSGRFGKELYASPVWKRVICSHFLPKLIFKNIHKYISFS